MNDERIKKLEESPIYAMSLGSKELFHSNFWAWLMRKNPYMINVFFGDISVEKDNGGNFILNGNSVNPEKLIQREDKHRDITINLSDGVYIIENKIKSLPYVEQLVKYQIEAGALFKGGVFTALEDPDFDTNKKYKVSIDKTKYDVELHKEKDTYNFVINGKMAAWKFLSYNKIISEIEKRIDKNNSDMDSCVIREYINVTRDIDDVIRRKLKENEKIFSLECSELHDLKDIYKKYKMSHFKRYIQKLLEQKLLEQYKDFHFVQDYSHDANLSIFCERVLESGIKKRVGIQIEGKQYRRYVEFLGGNKTVNFEKYKGKEWFADKENGFLNYGNSEKYPTTMRKNYCQYNKEIFMYQYWVIEKTTYCYDSLSKIIEKDMKKAKQVLNDE